MSATIGEVLASKGQFIGREQYDHECYRVGFPAKCIVTSRTGITRTFYGVDEREAYNVALDFVYDAGWNIPATKFATYRLSDPERSDLLCEAIMGA
jgi:hypothetical protein